MKQRKNLEQIKNMISKNKKIVIAIILIIILSLVIGIAFASKPSDNKKQKVKRNKKLMFQKKTIIRKRKIRKKKTKIAKPIKIRIIPIPLQLLKIITTVQQIPIKKTLPAPILETLETAVPTSRANLLTSIRGNSTPHRSGCPTW